LRVFVAIKVLPSDGIEIIISTVRGNNMPFNSQGSLAKHFGYRWGRTLLGWRVQRIANTSQHVGMIAACCVLVIHFSLFMRLPANLWTERNQFFGE